MDENSPDNSDKYVKIESMGTLTIDKILEISERYKIPFLAYTMNPRTYQSMKDQAKPAPSEFPSGRDMISGVLVYVVQTQKENCIEWDNKEKLAEYLDKTR